MKKKRYKVDTIAYENSVALETTLNKIAKEGWQIVHVLKAGWSRGEDYVTVIFEKI